MKPLLKKIWTGAVILGVVGIVSPPAAWARPQTLVFKPGRVTIGSATSGAGAGKIKFNEFTIKKTTDKASPRKSGKPAFEIKDFSFGVENPTTIKSATD